MRLALCLLLACAPTSTVPLDASQDAPPDAGRTYRDAVTDYASAFCRWQARCYDTDRGACVDAMIRDVCQRVPCGEAYPVEREGELELCRVGLEQAWCAPFPSQAVCEGAVMVPPLGVCHARQIPHKQADRTVSAEAWCADGSPQPAP